MKGIEQWIVYFFDHPIILVFFGTVMFIALRDKLSGTYITIKECKDTMKNYSDTSDLQNLTVGSQKCNEYRANIDKTFIDIKLLLNQIGTKTDKLYDMLYEHVKDAAKK